MALVSEHPGTTRDVIEVQLDLEGIPVTLLDTAGLRATDDPIEAEGVRRAEQRAAAADLRLRVIEATDPAPLAEAEVLVVRNKTDLASDHAWTDGTVPISCRTGAGVAELLALLTRRLQAEANVGEAPLLTRARHRTAVAAAEASLARLLAEAEGASELALLAEELRLATRAIGTITGAVGVEDVLDRIFASFCIGK